MVTLAWLLLAIGGLVSLVGWILLVVAAFREGVGWGLLILFLSGLVVPVIVFAVKFWPQAKAGVLASIAGVVLVAGGGMLSAGSLASSMMTEMGDLEVAVAATEIPTGPPAVDGVVTPIVPSPVPPTATPTIVLDPIEPRPTIGAAPPSAEARAAAEYNRRLRERAWGRELPWTEAADHVGQTIEVHRRDGGTFMAVLQAADPDSIRVEQRVGGGAVTFSLSRDAVRQLRISD